MKKIAFVFIALAGLFFQQDVLAQKGQGKGKGQASQEERRPKSPEEQAERRTKKMVERYQLNDKQAGLLKAANLEFAQGMRALPKGKDNKEARRPQAKALREAHQAKIKGILTAEQYARLEADRKEAQAKAEQRRAERAQNGGGKGNGKGKGKGPKAAAPNDLDEILEDLLED